jgi:hypothetical protein
MVGRTRIWSAAALAAMLVAAPMAAGADGLPQVPPPAPIDARLAAAKAAMMGDPAAP